LKNTHHFAIEMNGARDVIDFWAGINDQYLEASRAKQIRSNCTCGAVPGNDCIVNGRFSESAD
jgi:hypothetical protein